MKKLSVLVLVTTILSGCVTELWNEKLPGAYDQLPTNTHDVYRVGVIGCSGAVFTVIAVEVPFSGHEGGSGWYVIPIDVDLRPLCQ